MAYEVLCPKNDCGRGELFKNPTLGNNAVTWVSGIRDGQNTRAKIVYSPGFLDALAKSFGPGASYGVLAHEVGHHLTAALSMRQPFESSWNEELRADYLAGCALGRAGRTSSELENALRALAAVASKSHPSFKHRVPVVRKGFNNCRGQADIVAKKRSAFGLGNLVKKARKGCWRYWYRLRDEADRVGPIASKRRESRRYRGKLSCETARQKRAEERFSEECICQ